MRRLNILFGITYLVINPYCLGIFLRKGSPSFITASSPVALGRKPQSTYAFKKALDKLVNVYQHPTSSGMQWHGIQPVIHL